MEILKIIASILFVVVCIALILFVLIQQPKQSGLSSSMGTGKDFFGGRGFEGGLVKITSALGVSFIVLALLLSFLSR
jgi:preprotein translocase subunit SecG